MWGSGPRRIKESGSFVLDHIVTHRLLSLCDFFLQEIWWAKRTPNALFSPIQMNQIQRRARHTALMHSPDPNQASSKWRRETRPYRCVLRIYAMLRMSIGEDTPDPFPVKWRTENTWPCLPGALFQTWPRARACRPRRTSLRDTRLFLSRGKKDIHSNMLLWWKITKDKTMGFWVT